MIALGTMKRACKIHINHRGFTMIEIIVVMIIMAIFIATVAIPYTSLKFVNTDVDLPNERDILKSSLRFAQIKALNNAVQDTDTWGIHLDSTSYTYYRNGVPAYYYDQTGNKLIDNLPGECGNNLNVCTPSPIHSLPSGMTITTGAGTTVSFNKWGSPGASNISIVLTKAGSPPILINVTVTESTGYFSIQ
jgi:prepilin-type N-terminal cleavage/methylation domain-containing protein